jgi:hypothetical protein
VGRAKAVMTGLPAAAAATWAVTVAVVVLEAVSTPTQVMLALPEAGAVQVTTVLAGLPLVNTGAPSVPVEAVTLSETSVARYMPLLWEALQVTVTALPGAMPEQVPGTVVQSPAPTDSEATQTAWAADGAKTMRDATSAQTIDLGVMAGVQVQGSRPTDALEAKGLFGRMASSIRGTD